MQGQAEDAEGLADDDDSWMETQGALLDSQLAVREQELAAGGAGGPYAGTAQGVAGGIGAGAAGGAGGAVRGVAGATGAGKVGGIAGFSSKSQSRQPEVTVDAAEVAGKVRGFLAHATAGLEGAEVRPSGPMQLMRPMHPLHPMHAMHPLHPMHAMHPMHFMLMHRVCCQQLLVGKRESSVVSQVRPAIGVFLLLCLPSSACPPIPCRFHAMPACASTHLPSCRSSRRCAGGRPTIDKSVPG